MKRILLFITGFLFIYVLAVVALNLLPERTQEPQAPQTPQIQIQQQEETASPSAKDELVAPDL